MSQHYRSFPETKQQYREILERTKRQLEGKLLDLRQQARCTACHHHPADETDAWFRQLDARCGYRAWQQGSLTWLEQDLGRELLEGLQRIEAYRNAIACHQCGICCRLASSEHSYEELQRQAAQGDDFARQFTGIFLPFASREIAQTKFPEIVQEVLKEAGEPETGEERVFFYHCPYIGEDNRCTIYGTAKRPAICGSYPETPLSFVYEKCAWRSWKDETHPDALIAHATLAVAQDLVERLKTALS